MIWHKKLVTTYVIARIRSIRGNLCRMTLRLLHLKVRNDRIFLKARNDNAFYANQSSNQNCSVPSVGIVLLFVLNLFCISNSFAANEVYEYTDALGHTVFSNIRPNNTAKQVALPPLSIYARPMSRADFNADGYTTNQGLIKTQFTKTPDDYTRYFTPAQNNMRTQILADELNKEELALVSAKKMLLTSQKLKTANMQNDEQTQVLYDAITQHEKNIEILKTEINP